MREKEQPDQWSRPLPVQRGGEPPPSAIKQSSQSNGKLSKRVINREEREIPNESSAWFNLGLAALGIAAGAATGAATIVNSPVIKAVLWAVAACVAIMGISYFVAHREINRGRRVKRSQVIESVEEA